MTNIYSLSPFYHNSSYELPYRILNFANFKSSCFVPALTNSTVALVLSPVPSILMIVPSPKRWCSICEPILMVPAAVFTDVGKAAEGDDDCDEEEYEAERDDADETFTRRLPP